jgi:hypothetical protein
MDKFFSEVQARPYSLKNVPLESLHKIWNGLCSTLLGTISSGKVQSSDLFFLSPHVIYYGARVVRHRMVLLIQLFSPQGMSVANFGTWSFHVDPVDLGTQKRVLKTPVFTLSEKFARQYNVRCPRQPSGIRHWAFQPFHICVQLTKLILQWDDTGARFECNDDSICLRTTTRSCKHSPKGGNPEET